MNYMQKLASVKPEIRLTLRINARLRTFGRAPNRIARQGGDRQIL